ncbi:hypothetical protein [Rathayibacter sp. Leaf248]|uniref:hypothetical protein n=1 Tax=Rathayibacter sp. Leaf248 TaxID=2876555 RepID=UPI001E3C9265|nr:hypothetical protein [Rathayibacter sp. Leaf248]
MVTASRAAGVITNPDPEAPVLRLPLTSDSFSGSDTANIVGRSTDVALGGSRLLWQGTSGVWGIASERLVPLATTAAAVAVASPVADYELSFVVATAPVAQANFLLDVRRAALAVSPAPDGYRLSATVAAAPTVAGAPPATITMQLVKRVAAVSTSLAAGLTAAVGDRIGIRVKSGAGTATITVIVNGVTSASYIDTSPIVGSGFAGVGSGGNLAGLSLDSMVLAPV